MADHPALPVDQGVNLQADSINSTDLSISIGGFVYNVPLPRSRRGGHCAVPEKSNTSFCDGESLSVFGSLLSSMMMKSSNQLS